MKKIKYMILDVDGTLTDGKLCIGHDGELFKGFSVKDGVGINYYLKKAGIIPVIITARESKIVENRCRELGINHVFQGNQCKEQVLSKAVGESDLKYCAYMGDDLPDVPCMIKIKRAGGIVACPADAVSEVRQICDYICTHNSGDGAVREFIEHIILGEQKLYALSDDNILNTPSSKLFMEVIKDEYSKERQRAISLDNIASSMFVVVLAILAFAISQIPFGKFRNVSGTTLENVFFDVGVVVLGVGFVFLIASCLDLLKAFALKNCRRLSEIELTDDKYCQVTSDKSAMELLKMYKQSTEKYEKLNYDKCQKIEGGMKLGIIGISIFAIASMFLQILIGG